MELQSYVAMTRLAVLELQSYVAMTRLAVWNCIRMLQ